MAHSSTHLIGSPATDILLCLFALVMRECRPLKSERPSAQQHRLAVDHERAVAVAQRGL
jgi:hypothetical protein